LGGLTKTNPKKPNANISGGPPPPIKNHKAPTTGKEAARKKINR